MPATAAQVAANRANALKSTGPKTAEGKLASRGNALTHGLTAVVVTLEGEAEAVDQRYRDFRDEFEAAGTAAQLLALRAARLSVRMERCAEHEHAHMARHVRRAQLDFVPPEGVDPDEATRLRAEAGRLAMFDGSKEATSARKYEAAAERGFLRCLKELRSMQRQVQAARASEIERELASISHSDLSDEELDELSAEFGLPPMPKSFASPSRGNLGKMTGGVDVPISIGKRR